MTDNRLQPGKLYKTLHGYTWWLDAGSDVLRRLDIPHDTILLYVGTKIYPDVDDMIWHEFLTPDSQIVQCSIQTALTVLRPVEQC